MKKFFLYSYVTLLLAGQVAYAGEDSKNPPTSLFAKFIGLNTDVLLNEVIKPVSGASFKIGALIAAIAGGGTAGATTIKYLLRKYLDQNSDATLKEALLELYQRTKQIPSSDLLKGNKNSLVRDFLSLGGGLFGGILSGVVAYRILFPDKTHEEIKRLDDDMLKGFKEQKELLEQKVKELKEMFGEQLTNQQKKLIENFKEQINTVSKAIEDLQKKVAQNFEELKTSIKEENKTLIESFSKEQERWCEEIKKKLEAQEQKTTANLKEISEKLNKAATSDDVKKMNNSLEKNKKQLEELKTAINNKNDNKDLDVADIKQQLKKITEENKVESEKLAAVLEKIKVLEENFENFDTKILNIETTIGLIPDINNKLDSLMKMMGNGQNNYQNTVIEQNLTLNLYEKKDINKKKNHENSILRYLPRKPLLKINTFIAEKCPWVFQKPEHNGIFKVDKVEKLYDMNRSMLLVDQKN